MARSRRLLVAPLLALALLLPPLALVPPVAKAAAIVVTSAADPAGPVGSCTLRQALVAANSNTAQGGCPAGSASGQDMITFAAGITTIVPTTVLPPITTSVAIQGAGLVTIQGSNTFPLLTVTAPGLAVGVAGLTLDRGYAANYGGNLRVTGANLTVTDVALTNATAAAGQGGAGMYFGGGTATLTRVRVEGNTAPGSTYETGAGIYIDDYYDSSDVTINDSTVRGNTATNYSGGGIAIVRDSGVGGRALALRLTNTAIGTTASPNRAPGGKGGGIYALQATVTLTNSSIVGNRSDGDGAGIYAESTPLTMTGSSVTGNVSNSGPGGGISATGAAVTLTSSTITGNMALIGGGAAISSGSLTLTGSTIASNSSAAGGGGLFAGGTNATIINSTIAGNTAGGVGGGIYAQNVSGVTRGMTLTATTIVNNTAGGAGGGGIYASGSSASFQSVPLDRTIIAGNTVGGAANDCARLDANATFPAGVYNLVGAGGGCNPGGAGTRTLTGALSTAINPTLANNGGPTLTHNLVPGGPAHETIPAVPTNECGPTTDQRGVARPQGTACDIGAVEYTPPAASPSPTPSPSPSPSGPAPSFADVPVGYWAHDQIIAFAQRGITTGCDTDAQGNKYYCPERGVTRAEMAVFLTRTLGQDQQAASATPTFADVPTDYWAYRQIEAFVKLGITTGCGTDEMGQRIYCPERGVTRAEMAAFLVRAKGQTPLTPATPTFADVPASYWAYGQIERFLDLKVTTGCGTDDNGNRLYCPERGVTRAEMAVFIIRAYP